MPRTPLPQITSHLTRNIRFLVEKERGHFVEEATLSSIGPWGFSFLTRQEMNPSRPTVFSFQFKKHHLDVEGLASPGEHVQGGQRVYWVELDSDDHCEMVPFLRHFVRSFPLDSLRESLEEILFRVDGVATLEEAVNTALDDRQQNLKNRLGLVEKEIITLEIERNGGNKSLAAKEMGISREALRKKMLRWKKAA